MRLPFVFVVLLVGFATSSPVVIEDLQLRAEESLTSTTESLTSTTEGLSSTTEETLTSTTEGLSSTTEETLTSTTEGLSSTTEGLSSTTEETLTSTTEGLSSTTEETLTSTTEGLSSTTEETLTSTSANDFKLKFKISLKSLFNSKLIPFWNEIQSKLFGIFTKNDADKAEHKAATRIGLEPIIIKTKGLSSTIKEKIFRILDMFKNLPIISKIVKILTTNEDVVEEAVRKVAGKGLDLETIQKFFKEQALNFDSLEQMFDFVENSLETVVGSTFVSNIVNSLIEDVAEELPIEIIEEIFELVPWSELEDTLLNLDTLSVEKIQETIQSFKPLFDHILEKLSLHEDDIVENLGNAISEEAQDREIEDMAEGRRKAEFLLQHIADAMTNDNLRHFTERITEAIVGTTEAKCSEARTKTPMKVVCYYPNWVYYRKGAGKYTVDDIDTSLCTHIIYSFVILDGEKHIIKAHDTWLDIDRSGGSRGWNLGNFRKFTALKKTNPNVKYMLALGGWNDSKMPKYSELLASPDKIERFVEHAVGFLKEYSFDGLDLDYEYPSYDGHGRDAPDSDKPGFTLLCKKLSEAFKEHNYELTAAVSASQSVIANAYEIPEISKYLDAIHMMSYDMHGSWEKLVNHHSPLYGADWDPLTTDFGANYWVSQGCPKHKLIVGIPTYGRSWTLGGWDSKEWEYEINTTASKAGAAGPLTKAKGFLAYNEICQFVKNDGWTKVSDPTNNMGPYAYKGSQWVGYDDPAIAKVKAEYILEKQFGGAMFWDLPSDDFSNLCGEGKYPIIGAVSSVLMNQNTCGDEPKPVLTNRLSTLADAMTNENLRHFTKQLARTDIEDEENEVLTEVEVDEVVVFPENWFSRLFDF